MVDVRSSPRGNGRCHSGAIPNVRRTCLDLHGAGIILHYSPHTRCPMYRMLASPDLCAHCDEESRSTDLKSSKMRA